MKTGSQSCVRQRLLPACSALLAAWVPLAAARADVTGEAVEAAIRRGTEALVHRQLADGRWPERYYAGGESCLVTFALLKAGQPADRPALAAAIGFVRGVPLQHVYVVSLKIMALVEADPVAYRKEIEAATQWLIAAQNETGLWSYTPGGKRFDHSNSQFALLALHAAAEAGFRVHESVWNRARIAVQKTQNDDGGWDYMTGAQSYGSMTAAGVSDLLILGRTPTIRMEHGFRNGAAPNCGTYKFDEPLVRGLDWLGRNFRVDANPQRGTQWVYYWLYGVERCGILAGQRYLGQHEWYRAGARYLVQQQQADGTWESDLANTCFALLFLSKGHRALLVQKLQWSDDNAWNLDRHDLEYLTAQIGDQLGEPVAWQTVRWDASLDEWLAAPLLYMQGHDFPAWDEDQNKKMRDFIEQGGVLLAEACCGRYPFRRGFEEFARQTFPEVPLVELGPDHPIYHTVHDLRPMGLMGLNVGCRTSVIFSPRDLSCLWEQGNIPRLSDEAFKLGTNIAAYATGRRPLRDRLDVVTLPVPIPANAGPPQRDALRFAQVVHDGDWRPDPQALVHFAEFLRDELNMNVITEYRALRLTDSDLYACPLLYMTGHFAFELSAAEQAALGEHLRRGGFLLADACCGRPAFDGAFRKLMRQVFPNERLEPIPLDHAIFRGEPGFSLSSIEYKPEVLEEEPDLHEPRLWGVTLAGRLAVVYSPYALGCGLDGHVCYGCRGVVDTDARRLAANITLYALTH